MIDPGTRYHPAGTCEQFNIMSEFCKTEVQSCKDYITKYCIEKMQAESEGRSLEPDLSPKSMIIVDIVVSFGCVFMALFGSYFAYEDYQDSEYDDGDADTASGSDGRYIAGANGAMMNGTIGRVAHISG